VPPACKGAAVAATERLRATWRLLCHALFGGLFGGMAVTSTSQAASLAEDKAEVLVHGYTGGGVRAVGPALLIRKSLANKVSLSGQVYVDAVSNASIDVVTTASPFKETRTAYDLGVQALVRDSTLSLSASSSREPDYIANAVNLDVAHEVFGGMTTLSLGYTRGADKVGKKGVQGWIDDALHWQYRAGVTQILTPRWLVSMNAEAINDSGYLGSPYRVARVFGAAVNERHPRTRSSRAIKLRTMLDTDEWLRGSAVRAEYRAYWDNWKIRAGTTEVGFSKYLGDRFLLDTTLRLYTQSKALFYSDNAQVDTQYVSRNRQLSAFSSTGVGARISYTWPGQPGGVDLKLHAAVERKNFRFKDFTDLRSGELYGYNASVVQAYVTATF
jgi:Protein of unknown function (DUF3570)